MPRGYQPKLTKEQTEEICNAPRIYRSKFLASKYGVTEARISQIRALRKKENV